MSRWYAAGIALIACGARGLTIAARGLLRHTGRAAHRAVPAEQQVTYRIGVAAVPNRTTNGGERR